MHAGHLTTADGVATLTTEFALNAATAGDFIYDYKQLMAGKVFHRAMSAPAMRYFIQQISIKHGQQALSRALASLQAHIQYYEGHYKTTLHKMRAVVEDLSQSDSAPRSAAQVEQEFQASVAQSLRDTQAARLQRLAQLGETTPKTISVHAIVFVRNPDVVAATLVRAEGVCERCKCKAPFQRAKDGTPYLEVHHRVRLASGGVDSLENAIALCPNCHREVHYGAADA